MMCNSFRCAITASFHTVDMKVSLQVEHAAAMLYLQSAFAQMRQVVVLLKKVSRPATARLMSVLVGLRSRVVKRGK